MVKRFRPAVPLSPEPEPKTTPPTLPTSARVPASLQESVATMLAFTDGPEGATISAQVRPEHFDGQYRDIARAVLRYRSRYGEPPGAAHLEDLMLRRGEGEDRQRGLRRTLRMMAILADAINPEYVANRVQEFVRGQVIKTALLEASERFLQEREEGLVADVEAILTKALSTPVDASGKSGTGVLTLDEFNRLPGREPELLMSPWLEAGSVTMIHAPAGHLKTFLAMHVAACLADCVPALGGRWLPARPARVLFVDGELSVAGMKERTRRLPVRRRLNIHVLSRRGAASDGVKYPSLYTREGRAMLDRAIEKCRAEVVILDSIFTLFGAITEKELENWSAVAEWLTTHQDAGRAVVLVHHDPKSGKAYGTVLRSVLVDNQISIDGSDAESDEPEERAIEIAFAKHRAFGGAAAAAFLAWFRVGNGYHWRSEEKPDSSGDKAETKSAWVSRMLEEGYEPKAIMDETGVSKELVSQIKKKLAGEGSLV